MLSSPSFTDGNAHRHAGLWNLPGHHPQEMV